MALTKSCIIPIHNYAEASTVSTASIALLEGHAGNLFSANVNSDELSLGQTANISSYSKSKTEMKIGKKLIALGIPPHMKGFAYLREAVLMLFDDENLIYSITKLMYPPIAKKFSSTAPSVEKSVRHAIETSWALGEDAAIRTCFRHHSTRPTNSEFVAYFFQSLSMNLLDK